MRMTIGTLRAFLDALPREQDQASLCVWLPGSRIDIGLPFYSESEQGFMMEGNVRDDSALCELIEGPGAHWIKPGRRRP